MAKCQNCEKEYGIFELKNKICKSCINKETPQCLGCGNNFAKNNLKNGFCEPCYLIEKNNDHKNQEYQNKQNKLNEIKKLSDEELKKIILTTESQVDFKIDKRIDIITSECAFGMNIFKDMFTGVRDIIGGRSESLQKTLRESKDNVLNELRREAYSIGGNAVIGVDLDYSEFSGGGKSMLFIVASGTAVVSSEIK